LALARASGNAYKQGDKGKDLGPEAQGGIFKAQQDSVAASRNLQGYEAILPLFPDRWIEGSYLHQGGTSPKILTDLPPAWEAVR
jgi:hypothetical protein